MRHKIKWIFTVVAIILFFLFGGIIPNDDLRSRAMAVGLGIDYRDGELVVCAQILTASDSSGAPAGTRVVEARGRIFSEAISKITEICGLALTVTHCNVILLGENLVDEGKAYEQIFALLGNTYVSDNAYVFVCEGTPMEMFSQVSAFGDNASQYLQQLISGHGSFDNICYKMIRQIIVDTHNKGETTYLPYIEKIPVKPLIPPVSDNSSGPANSAFAKGKENDSSFSMNKIIVLKREKKIGIYDEDGAKSLNYIMSKISKGSDVFNIESGTIGVFVIHNDSKKKYNLKEKTFEVYLHISGTVKDFTPKSEVDRDEKTFKFQPTEKEINFCGGKIKERIEKFFKETQKMDADVFAIRQGMYSKFGKESEKIKLQDINLKLNVEFSIEK